MATNDLGMYMISLTLVNGNIIVPLEKSMSIGMLILILS